MKKKIVLCILALLAVPLSYGAYVLFLQSFNNFHVVYDGELYRSAQPDADDLEAYISEYGIKSVINLRGYNPARAWYRDEARAAKKLGLNFYDIHMHSRKEVKDEDMTALIKLMEQAPKPMLLHCHSGANRTGLATALYQMYIKNTPYSESEHALSMWYGHTPLFIPDTIEMNKALFRASKNELPH